VSQPIDRPPVTSSQPHVPVAGRIVAAIEVLLCSDFPTQIAVGGTLQALGYAPPAHGPLRIGYVAARSDPGRGSSTGRPSEST